MRKDKIKELEDRIYALEMSDERLFTNGNGNLARYNAMKAELAALLKKYQRSKIKCLETGEIFDSATDACRILKCSRSTMSNHLAGRYPHIRGKHFKRIN